jgi:hypothetical protein
MIEPCPNTQTCVLGCENNFEVGIDRKRGQHLHVASTKRDVCYRSGYPQRRVATCPYLGFDAILTTGEHAALHAIGGNRSRHERDRR